MKQTIKHAKARIRTKRGFDSQVLTNGYGVFFYAHLPSKPHGAVEAAKL